jgi:CheY-like chemotaxis protein/anti-sigma regulatory factor (Ser/Thr protein kinase)
VAASGEHLLQVINDVLDLSKIDAGKMRLHAGDFAMESLLDGVHSMMGEVAAAKGLALEIEAVGVSGHWHGDVTRLSQALINLMSNAVKFTERGSVSLRVTDEAGEQAREAAQAGRHLLRFEVRDTGEGISPERQASLFNAFEQADNSMTRRHGGTGLGLALTRCLAELMGGTVGVRSSVGQGSTFWFTAWLEPAQAALETPSGQDIPARFGGLSVEEIRRHHAGKRVLLAEDNPVNQEVANALLDAVGLHVDTVADGAAAVAAVAAIDYDLVLMDMQMPGMDGLAATRAIRARREGRQPPILAMTANAFAEDREACLLAGMDDHVAKPVDPGQLYATLLRWLTRSA